MAETVSTTPWSNFKESDYSEAQWARACLLDRGPDSGQGKIRYALPVREPSGALNANGMAAAAGALGGARSGVKATPEQKDAASKKLTALYNKLGKPLPSSLAHADLGTTGNTTAGIMAIPSPMDPIRLVGDEEKHATLLFFGETSTLPGGAKQTLLDSVELASSMLFPFGEAVVDVRRLGSDVPPALVALLAGEKLNQIRNLFLMNPAVSGYRDNADQFPGFTPHVTLSHPDFADEAIQRALMRQVYGVSFDRLSVWWNDERLDFDLNPSDQDSMAQAIEDFLAQHGYVDSEDGRLAHHGIRGQKWGVRRRVDSATGRVEQTGTTGLTTGLKPRTGSADQIQQDRIQKKIDTVGVHALSTAELRSYSQRLQVEKDVNRALAEQSAAQKAKAEGLIRRTVKKQAGRQADRVLDKATDIAVEKALEAAGIHVGKKNAGQGEFLKEISTRIQPNNKKKGK